MAADSNEVVLQNPVKLGEHGETITVLKFREPKAKDFRDLPLDMKMGDMLNLAGKLCGKTTPEMDLLSTADFFTVMEIVGKFMPDGQKTGQTL